MIRVLFALAVLSLASLACGGQFVATVTPTSQPPQVVTQVTPVSTPTNTPASALPPSPVPTAADVATVVQATVNLRAEPDGAVIGSLAAGDSVTVIRCDADWCEIETEQMSGFIFAGCLSGYGEGKGCEAK
jgi:hypothetical protein